MKRFTLVILALFFVLINTCICYGESYTKKNIALAASDGFNLKATLTYPKIKGKREYKTVILIHSLGTNSGWWGELPSILLKNGYATLAIDLRGHGGSVYNARLGKVSWKNLTNNAYKKYPKDVTEIVNYIQEEYPKLKFFNDWAIVGSDIGGSAGIIAADMLNIKPKTIVLLSPVVQTKGLYVPVSVAQLNGVDFLSISSVDDAASLEAEKYIMKFAQNEFSIYTSPSKHSGMVLLKNDPEIAPFIAEWLKQYLND